MTFMATLLLTNSDDATSDYLENYLLKSGLSCIRYNTNKDLSQTSFTYKDHTPVMQWKDHYLKATDVTALVFRRPKPFTPETKADEFQLRHIAEEWAETWEGFLAHIELKFWVNHPSRNFSASHKIEQLSRAERLGLRVPHSCVTTDPGEALRFIQGQTNGVIVKPLASGYIERDDSLSDTVIYTREFKEADYHFLDKIRSCPVLFQEKIAKALDVRLTVLDGESVAVGMKAFENGVQRLDIRRHGMFDVEYSVIDIPIDVSQPVSSMMVGYGLRFAALDFAIDNNGEWIFFEVNPNGQWAWLDIDAGAGIGDIFVSNFSRLSDRPDLRVR